MAKYKLIIDGKEIHDANGNPIYVSNNCRIKDPGGNEICTYMGHFFVRKRHRDGSFVVPEKWLGITEEFYNIFLSCGSKIVPVPKQVIDYYNFNYK